MPHDPSQDLSRLGLAGTAAPRNRVPAGVGLFLIGLALVVVVGVARCSSPSAAGTPSPSAVTLATPTAIPAVPTAAPSTGPTRAPADTFSATGPMSIARWGATATLLADGRVLVAEGYDRFQSGETSISSAEVYDPATGAFSPTSSMSVPRAGHTATLLADGRVLIAGGSTSSGAGLTSAELYDPATGTFNPTGSMAGPRQMHTAMAGCSSPGDNPTGMRATGEGPGRTPGSVLYQP